MPTNDQLNKLGFDREVKRHADRLRYLANHIQEYAAYLVRDVENGQSSMAVSFARGIKSDVDEALEKMAALDALRDVAFMVEKPTDTSEGA